MKHAVILMLFIFREIRFVIELSNIKVIILITVGCSSYLNQFQLYGYVSGEEEETYVGQ